MRIHTILNAKAGSLIDLDPDEVANDVKSRLCETARDVRIDLVEPQDISNAIDKALAEKIDTLVVGGGDGTVKAAATKLVGTDVALGIIPLGTMNLMARDLRIPFEPIDAAAALARGTRRTIDVADVNGHVFLCSSLLGLPIYMAEQRQALRGSSLPDRMSGYMTMARDFLGNRRRFEIEVDDGQYARRVRALSIAVSNNPLAEKAGAFPMRRCLDSGQLALYLSKHRTGGAMGLAIMQRMLGRWTRDPEIEELFAERIVLNSRRSLVRASNDGEIEELRTPLTYSIKPNALWVIDANQP